jgi:hypothetical protein
MEAASHREEGAESIWESVSCAVRSWPINRTKTGPAPGLIADPPCVSATFSTGNDMSADRKASFKQPPRHVIDTALSQEVRRNKVCRCETTCIITCPAHNASHVPPLIGIRGAKTRATYLCCIRKCYSTHIVYLETGEACGE